MAKIVSYSLILDGLHYWQWTGCSPIYSFCVLCPKEAIVGLSIITVFGGDWNMARKRDALRYPCTCIKFDTVDRYKKDGSSRL